MSKRIRTFTVHNFRTGEYLEVEGVEALGKLVNRPTIILAGQPKINAIIVNGNGERYKVSENVVPKLPTPAVDTKLEALIKRVLEN